MPGRRRIGGLGLPSPFLHRAVIADHDRGDDAAREHDEPVAVAQITSEQRARPAVALLVPDTVVHEPRGRAEQRHCGGNARRAASTIRMRSQGCVLVGTRADPGHPPQPLVDRGVFDPPKKPVTVRDACLFGESHVDELVLREQPHGLEHLIAPLAGGPTLDERLRGQRSEDGGHGRAGEAAADPLGGGECPAPGEHREC